MKLLEEEDALAVRSITGPPDQLQQACDASDLNFQNRQDLADEEVAGAGTTTGGPPAHQATSPPISYTDYIASQDYIKRLEAEAQSNCIKMANLENKVLTGTLICFYTKKYIMYCRLRRPRK